ncbi:MAG: sigma-54-dependent Fis family transcriptional regulator [Deltaproteobacteria bacterium]|nr:MAG: sigma-54-dependent Fis family transcriptional regulator [Deltaproteobacteria bacterium]
MAKVLIIDDDVEMCMMLADLAGSIRHESEFAHTLSDGLNRAVSGNFDLVFLDVKMPDGNGLEILKKIRAVPFPPEVIIITGAGDSDGAEIAIKNGAWDYLQKPLSPKHIILPLTRVLQYRDGLKKSSKPPLLLNREGIIGNSLKIRECLTTMAQAANTDVNVFITGETGTGKELFARAIHRNSHRSDNPFIVVDCAALPETLVESTLFGHEKGAFTGADQSKEGLIRQADGGTLFLDEVGELSPRLQKAFLRVLQERSFRPVGSKKEIKSDFRLIAATNRELDQMVGKQMFRKDFLYRLKSICIKLPPLRDRMEDIKDLVVYLTDKIFTRHQIDPKGYSPDFITALSQYEWPGNIRELLNTLEATISQALYEPILFPKHLPEPIRIKMAQSTLTNAPRSSHIESTWAGDDNKNSQIPSFKIFRESSIASAESRYFSKLMELTHGNIKQSCAISGLSRTRLYTLLKKHGIDRTGWSQKKRM